MNFSAATTHRPLVDRIWPVGEATLLRQAALVIFGSLLLWASAKAQVPMWPVPMTMQSGAILVIGMAYGFRLGTAAMALYLFEGALGLPVFAGTPERGIGVAYMVGPTGGYLLGFLVATAMMGWLAERGWDRTFSAAVAAMTLGTILPLVTGATWLATLVGWDKAIDLGVTPFLLGGVVKIALAAALLPLAWRAVASRDR
jgi:biotin transport system substrate-specific component